VWVFIAMVVGGFYPILVDTTHESLCKKCHEFHMVRINISSLAFGGFGVLWGIVFAIFLNRFALVAKSKPGDREVPISRLARYGRSLLGWRGMVFLLILVGVYFTCEYVRPTNPEKAWANVYCALCRNNADEVLKSIQESGEMKDELLNYAVGTAAYWGQKETVELLIENGANVNTRYQSVTLLMHAAQNRNKELVALLIEKGADVNAKFQGKTVTATPLDFSKSVGGDCSELLRYHGAKTAAELEAEGK
jgi:hypothetical protein